MTGPYNPIVSRLLTTSKDVLPTYVSFKDGENSLQASTFSHWNIWVKTTTDKNSSLSDVSDTSV